MEYCFTYTFSLISVEPVPTFIKTSSNVVKDTPKLENPNLSRCSVRECVVGGSERGREREDEKKRRREEGKEGGKEEGREGGSEKGIVIWCIVGVVVLTFECVEESGEMLAGCEGEEEGQLCTHV